MTEDRGEVSLERSFEVFPIYSHNDHNQKMNPATWNSLRAVIIQNVASVKNLIVKVLP